MKWIVLVIPIILVACGARPIVECVGPETSFIADNMNCGTLRGTTNPVCVYSYNGMTSKIIPVSEAFNYTCRPIETNELIEARDGETT